VSTVHFDPTSAEEVPASALRMLGEDVLVRPLPSEEIRSSGLYVPNTAHQTLVGGAFYGEVVAVGPGRHVTYGPSPEEVAQFVRDALCASPRKLVQGEDETSIVEQVAQLVRARVAASTKRAVLPLEGVAVGDLVMCKQGFGSEVILREGRHQVVSRGGDKIGRVHGVTAVWTREHVHCWHRAEQGVAACRCGERAPGLPTRLPACSSCPSGERLAEAVLGAPVAHVQIARGDTAGDFEERPVDDGRDDL
jgi:Chaperonin 10 Kd subunit